MDDLATTERSRWCVLLLRCSSSASSVSCGDKALTTSCCLGVGCREVWLELHHGRLSLVLLDVFRPRSMLDRCFVQQFGNAIDPLKSSKQTEHADGSDCDRDARHSSERPFVRPRHNSLIDCVCFRPAAPNIMFRFVPPEFTRTSTFKCNMTRGELCARSLCSFAFATQTLLCVVRFALRVRQLGKVVRRRGAHPTGRERAGSAWRTSRRRKPPAHHSWI